FGQAASSELFKEALQRANNEIDRVSGQLESKNRRLSIRSKFFNDLSEFQQGIPSDAAPPIVMRAIGQTAISFLCVSSCCVFSLMPGQDYAEAMLFDGNGDLFETTLIDCANRPPKPGHGEGPVFPAGSEMEWL